MAFGFRATHDDLGAVVNILVYTPCFSLISIGIYNIETTRANLRKLLIAIFSSALPLSVTKAAVDKDVLAHSQGWYVG